MTALRFALADALRKSALNPFAWLSRWLDRRIDAHVTKREDRIVLEDAARPDIHEEAHEFVERLFIDLGRSDAAEIELLRQYAVGPEDWRGALFYQLANLAVRPDVTHESSGTCGRPSAVPASAALEAAPSQTRPAADQAPLRRDGH